MLIPRFWAKTHGSATDPEGKRFQLQLWGWSDVSTADALATAGNRLAKLVERVVRGDPLDGYAYGQQPLREEIIRPVGQPGGRGEAIITRNRYGALVLNTAQVPFIDVDSPPAGGLSKLAGFFKRGPATDPALDRIREACGQTGRHDFRIYRTKAGYRVLATDMFLEPRAATTHQLMATFDADPFFIKLCSIQGSFRARLTPKPWRIGLRPPRTAFPRDDAEQREFGEWLEEYDAVSKGYATCRLVETIGSTRSSSETFAIVDEHDRITKATSDLPLA
jgi:hypothetical protein